MRFSTGLPARLALAVLFAFPASPLVAKSGSLSCKALSDRIMTGKTTAETRVFEDAQGCVITNLKIGMNKFQAWKVDRLTISGPDFRTLKKGQLLPSALKVEAHGIRFAPDIEESHTRYILQIQQHPFDARLNYEWDKATQQLHLRELALDSSLAGLISLSMDADLGRLDKRADLPEPKDLGIRRVRMVLDNAGILESMMIPNLIVLIPTDKDPAVEIPKAKERGLAQIRKLAPSVIDDVSKDALSRFISDFPHPRGHFEIEQTFDKPLRLGELKTMFPAGLAGLSGEKATWLQGSRLNVRYDPTAVRPGSPLRDAPAPAEEIAKPGH